jgi:tetratricopeptide (TPR) repeat protein
MIEGRRPKRLPLFFMTFFSYTYFSSSHSRLIFPLMLLLLVGNTCALAQQSPPARASRQKTGTSTSSPQPSGSQHGLDLATAGQCQEAVPLLKKSISQSSDKDFKHTAGLAGLRCAMVSNQFVAAQDFLRMLVREFPSDPEVLYAEVHTYSDLATRASQELATRAPDSAQAHELNAEALEMQGKWEQAQKEYEKVLQQDPNVPGIHFKVGRLLLSEPKPPADVAEQAKTEFQKELKIDPSNAGAEYVLGELARQAQDSDAAIQHFSQATKLDPNFSDAFLGLGMAFISAKQFPEAVPALEVAVKLEPQNPAAHYNLGLAYTRVGRREEADRQFAIHREMVAKSDERENAKPGMSTPQ